MTTKEKSHYVTKTLTVRFGKDTIKSLDLYVSKMLKREKDITRNKAINIAVTHFLLKHGF